MSTASPSAARAPKLITFAVPFLFARPARHPRRDTPGATPPTWRGTLSGMDPRDR